MPCMFTHDWPIKRFPVIQNLNLKVDMNTIFKSGARYCENSSMTWTVHQHRSAFGCSIRKHAHIGNLNMLIYVLILSGILLVLMEFHQSCWYFGHATKYEKSGETVISYYTFWAGSSTVEIFLWKEEVKAVAYWWRCGEIVNVHHPVVAEIFVIKCF